MDPDIVNNTIQEICSVFKKCESLTGIKKGNVANIKNDNFKKNQPNKRAWFNNECLRARRNYHYFRRKYRKSKTDHNSIEMLTACKQYKIVLAQSKRTYQDKLYSDLRSLKCGDNKRYWNIINNHIKTNKHDNANVPFDSLIAHFRSLSAPDSSKQHNLMPQITQ